jgi:hypothetical protein
MPKYFLEEKLKYFLEEKISVEKCKIVEKPEGLFKVYGFVGRKIMFIVAAGKCDKTRKLLHDCANL